MIGRVVTRGNVPSSLAAIIACAQLSVLALTGLPKVETSASSQQAALDRTPVVTLPVLVLDRARRPVTDLAQNEIKVYEGKAEQSIESLTLNPAAPARIGFLVDLSASSQGSLRKPDVLEQVLGGIRDYLDNTHLAAYRPKSPGPVSVKVRCTRKGVKVIAPDQRY